MSKKEKKVTKADYIAYLHNIGFGNPEKAVKDASPDLLARWAYWIRQQMQLGLWDKIRARAI